MKGYTVYLMRWDSLVGWFVGFEWTGQDWPKDTKHRIKRKNRWNHQGCDSLIICNTTRCNGMIKFYSFLKQADQHFEIWKNTTKQKNTKCFIHMKHGKWTETHTFTINICLLQSTVILFHNGFSLEPKNYRNNYDCYIPQHYSEVILHSGVIPISCIYTALFELQS